MVFMMQALLIVAELVVFIYLFIFAFVSSDFCLSHMYYLVIYSLLPAVRNPKDCP